MPEATRAKLVTHMLNNHAHVTDYGSIVRGEEKEAWLEKYNTRKTERVIP